MSQVISLLFFHFCYTSLLNTIFFLSILGNAHTFALYAIKLLHIYTSCVTFWQNFQCKKLKRKCEYLGQHLISVTWYKLHATEKLQRVKVTDKISTYTIAIF